MHKIVLMVALVCALSIYRCEASGISATPSNRRPNEAHSIGDMDITINAADMKRADPDTTPPTLTPYKAPYSPVKPNTPLSFASSEPIRPNDIRFAALGCIFDEPSVAGQIVTATLVTCVHQGTSGLHFSLSVTVLDIAGNIGTYVVKYQYDSWGPYLRADLAPYTVKPNTPLPYVSTITGVPSLIDIDTLQPTGITFVSSSCTFDTPFLAGPYAVVGTLLNCTAEGSFSVTVTALDMAGNPGTHTDSFV